jgi:hypothetical protein
LCTLPHRPIGAKVLPKTLIFPGKTPVPNERTGGVWRPG